MKFLVKIKIRISKKGEGGMSHHHTMIIPVAVVILTHKNPNLGNVSTPININHPRIAIFEEIADNDSTELK